MLSAAAEAFTGPAAVDLALQLVSDLGCKWGTSTGDDSRRRRMRMRDTNNRILNM
jgi:hypothetical protein